MNLNIIGNWIKGMSSRELSEMTPEQITDGVKKTLLGIPEIKEALAVKDAVSKVTGKECDLVTELHILVDGLKMQIIQLQAELAIKKAVKKPTEETPVPGKIQFDAVTDTFKISVNKTPTKSARNV